MRKDQFEEITKWQAETFPTATPLSKVLHLQQEVEELRVDILHERKFEAVKEFADCLLLLFGAAKSFGLTYKNICDAIDGKMEINKKRKWGNPDENGVVNHIKD